jgi:2-polyprenyl-6-methoxyphenol hydroxylase-like FAD-dependent oxidoreductase
MTSADAYDAIVVGAGPAGSATGILLAESGMTVLVLDRATFPRSKMCGEYFRRQGARDAGVATDHPAPVGRQSHRRRVRAPARAAHLVMGVVGDFVLPRALLPQHPLLSLLFTLADVTRRRWGRGWGAA